MKMEKLSDKLIVRVGSERKQKLRDHAKQANIRFSKFVRLILNLGEVEHEKQMQSQEMQTAS